MWGDHLIEFFFLVYFFQIATQQNFKNDKFYNNFSSTRESILVQLPFSRNKKKLIHGY